MSNMNSYQNSLQGIEHKLHLYNSLERKVVPFIPLEDNKVKLYTCGPTVYNYAHIGNLRTYIFEDLLKRTLTYFGYKVKHVMNVTDVGHLVSDGDLGDDKMELACLRENKDAWKIAEFYLDQFKKDLENLNILFPDIWCKATEHIKEQIELIKELERLGVTYIIDDGVYFDTSKIDNYGKLANIDLDNLKEGARIGMVADKKNKTDFALWKISPQNQKRLMEWESPWGKGFPGWSIECSAMALKYLGDEIDIHCGGIDHIPVHHTNEIAQTETVTGKQWVNYWIHGEFLVMKNSKMSKSESNFITLTSLIENGLSPMAYKYFCLNAHYRNPVTFSWEALESSQVAIDRIYQKIKGYKASYYNDEDANISVEYINKFIDDVSHDLNFPKAISIIWEIIKDTTITDSSKYVTLLELEKLLGLGFESIEVEEDNENITEESVLKLVEMRNMARKNKDYKEADRIRKELLDLGYMLIDSKEGTVVKNC